MSMLNKLSKKNLKHNKRKTYLSLITVILASLLLTSAGVIPLNIYKDYKYKTQLESGKYQIAVNDLSKNELDNMSKENFINETGQSSTYGFKENEKFTLFYYDDNALEMSAFRLLQGHMPMNDDEIVIDEYYLDSKNIKKELNTKISIACVDMAGKKTNKDFKLTGIMSTTSQAKVKNIYYGFISKKLLDKLQEDNIRWSLYANTLGKNVDQVNTYVEALNSHYKINSSQYVINESFINSNKVDLNVLIGAGIVILVIIVATFMVIYSIFYISINEKISEFGKLRAIGATKKQIKKMIFREGIYLSGIGIPIGVILGYLISNIVSYKFLFKDSPYDSSGAVIVIIISVLLSLITVRISLIKPAKVAMRISPISAIAYNPTLLKESKNRKSEKNINVRKLTLLNLKRYRKRSLITIASISISITLFIIIGSVLNSFNMDRAAKQYISGDFELTAVRDQNNYKYGSFKDSLVNKIIDLNGVTEVNRVSLVNTLYKNEENLKFTSNDSRLQGIEEISSILFGYDDNMIYSLKDYVIDGEINIENLRNKNEIIIFREIGDKRFNTKAGDIINMKINDGNNQISQSFKVQAIIDRDGMESVDTIPLGEPFMIHNRVLNEILNKDYTIKLQLKCNKNNNGINEILSKLVTDNKDIQFKSLLETKSELNKDFKGIKIVAYSLVIVIAIISLVNYINTMLASVISRKKELGVLQAIGISNKQLYNILNFEGLFYLGISTVIALIAGSSIGYLIVKVIENEATFVNYKYPFLLVALLFLGIIIIQSSISKIIINRIKKESLIDRINK